MESCLEPCTPGRVTLGQQVCGEDLDKAWPTICMLEKSGCESRTSPPMVPLHPLPACLAAEALQSSQSITSIALRVEALLSDLALGAS